MQRSNQNRLCSFLLVCGITWFACLLVPAAWAHAVLKASIPAIDGTVDGGVIPIALTYNSRVDAAHSTLSLTAPDGHTQPLRIDTNVAPNELRSVASSLKPGKYTIRWQVVATDGHITRGAIPFVVR